MYLTWKLLGISIITQVIIEIPALSLAENGVIFRYNHLCRGDYSPLRKRVIACERSRAASSYGIIWGDADRNKQEEFSAECHSVDCF